MVSRGVHSDLPKYRSDVLNNNLFQRIMNGSGLKTVFKELHILLLLPFLGLPSSGSPSFWRTSLYIIYPFSVDPDPPPVYQAGSYSNTCPISRLPLLFVSCSNRNHIVQASSLINMAGTFVGAFNAEVTYLP